MASVVPDLGHDAAVNFPEIDRSAGETLRVIRTGKSMEIVRRNQNS